MRFEMQTFHVVAQALTLKGSSIEPPTAVTCAVLSLTKDTNITPGAVLSRRKEVDEVSVWAVVALLEGGCLLELEATGNQPDWRHNGDRPDDDARAISGRLRSLSDVRSLELTSTKGYENTQAEKAYAYPTWKVLWLDGAVTVLEAPECEQDPERQAVDAIAEAARANLLARGS